MPFLASLRAGANLVDVFRKFPETSRPLIEFHEALLRGPSPFTAAERELIAAYVSGVNQCRYCHAVHAATAQRLVCLETPSRALLQGPKPLLCPKK
jgi:AhpD family alkylhydroperoxidase